MKSFALIFISFFFLTHSSKAQENFYPGARQAALGGTGILYTDVWSSAHNQAGLADLKGYAFGSYFNNRFGINELSTKAFALAASVGNAGTFGLNYTQFGYELHSQNKFGLAYGMRLGEKITAGIQIDYFLITQGGEYGRQGFASGEIGMIAEPIENFFVAAHVFNPWPVKITATDASGLNSVFRLGTAYKFSDRVTAVLEAEKDIEYPVRVRFGTEYEFVDNLFLRLGANTQPAEYSFGIGYTFKGAAFDIGFKTHNTLGMHSHFGLSYLLRTDSKTDNSLSNP